MNALRGRGRSPRRSAGSAQRCQTPRRSSGGNHDRPATGPCRTRDRRPRGRPRLLRRGLGYAWGEGSLPRRKRRAGQGRGPLRRRASSGLERGQLLLVNFGVLRDDYCSDLQRVWYLAGTARPGVPAEVGSASAGALVGGRCGSGRPCEPGRRRLAGERRRSKRARCLRLPGADVRARPPAGPSGSRRRHAPRAALGPLRRGAARASSRRGTSSRSSSGPPSRAAATSASRKTCSSRADGVEWLSTPQRELWLLT